MERELPGRADLSGLAAVTGLGDGVRSQLYAYVSGSAAPVGRDEAAAAAGIGRGLAAYHLDKLVELGLLAAAYQRPAGRSGRGAGRPAKVYSRSGREFAVSVPPREYGLAAGLLARAVEAGGDTSRAALRAAARQCGAELGRRHLASHARLPGARQARARRADTRQAETRQAAEAALREHGFEPWHDQSGTIRLLNCPFRQLAVEHPDLTCGMNLALIEGITDGLGATALRPALDPGPGRCCVVIGTSEPGRDSGPTNGEREPTSGEGLR